MSELKLRPPRQQSLSLRASKAVHSESCGAVLYGGEGVAEKGG